MQINILVVDDSASDRMIINGMLSDYRILTACDGEEAIRILKEHDGINLLILDLNMPNVDGFQVLEYLKEDERLKKLRTIILTNYDELENEIRGLNLGAVDYIRKPIHLESLRARIDVHVSLLRTEFALKQQLNKKTLSFDMIFDQAPIGIAITNRIDPEHSDETLMSINSAFEQITGRAKEEINLIGWEKITHPDDLEEDLKNLKRLQTGEIKNYSMEKRYIRPDGSVVWVFMVVVALSNEGKDKYDHICLIQDISERKQMENERKYISEHDRLTGLYNRVYLVSFLENVIKQKKEYKKALVGINLSTIQLLTGNYGYQYTQSLIKKAAETLEQCCTEKHLLFQPREDRFVFYVFDYKDIDELVNFINVIAKALESIFVTDRIGGGIGVLEIDKDQDETDIDLLLRRLLIASERHINLFEKDFVYSFYDEGLEALVNRERDIVTSLNAIAADDYNKDELFLQYQPVLDLKTGLVSGFEALARLRTEEFGLVSPLEFIPIAEKTKLILPIGEKVIIKAFHFINRLREHGYDDISVSINISAIQLLKPDFTDRFFELMNGMQVNPRNIGIEITESVFASDFENINNIIEKLGNAEIQIAIDDFGTGYSSLSREKELNVNCLKIDRHFIDRLLVTDTKKAITSDIISMAHKQGHYTIAEGVEHDIQLQYLIKHSCDKVQGYLISKPLDEEDAIEFLKKHEQK